MTTLEPMTREPTNATGQGARDTRTAPTAPRPAANQGKRVRRGLDPRHTLGPHMRKHMQTMTKSKQNTTAQGNTYPAQGSCTWIREASDSQGKDALARLVNKSADDPDSRHDLKTIVGLARKAQRRADLVWGEHGITVPTVGAACRRIQALCEEVEAIGAALLEVFTAAGDTVSGKVDRTTAGGTR